MTLFAFVDNNLGIMFNHRRVSRDGVGIEKMLSLANGHTLKISPYSAGLFSGENVEVCENLTKDVTADDFCFIEDVSVGNFAVPTEKIILFRFNRDYPSDFRFDSDILSAYRLTSAEDFVGSSHEKITMEIYEK